jgi:hypothetical protein
MGRINIVKMNVVPKKQFMFKAISIQLIFFN